MTYFIAILLAVVMVMSRIVSANEVIATITGDCSPVTMNSTINKPITVNCYQPKEERDLEVLTTAPLVDECVFRYPNTWSWSGDSANGENTIVPPPGNAFSQYEFTFTYGLLHQTTWIYIFLNVSRITYPISSVDMDKKTFDSIATIRESTSGPFVQWRDYDMAYGETENPAPVTRLKPLRAIVQLEDGSEVQSSSLDVFIQDDRLWSSVFLTPVSEAYPDAGQDDSSFSPLYDFSCSAKKEMPSDLFAKICSMLIEQTTLNPKFTKQECSQSDEGQFKISTPSEPAAE